MVKAEVKHRSFKMKMRFARRPTVRYSLIIPMAHLEVWFDSPPLMRFNIIADLVEHLKIIASLRFKDLGTRVR